MEKLALSRVVIVEGKYDKIKLDAVLDAMIVATDGFRIYHNKERLAMLRAVARKQGAIIATDSDVAGFRIRSFLRSALQGVELAHVYIPQQPGKEKRKSAPGAEGLLGVEGMDPALLRELFLPFAGESSPVPQRITRMDFYEAGLCGGEHASERRQALAKQLGLPRYMTTNGLLEVINRLMTIDEWEAFLASLPL